MNPAPIETPPGLVPPPPVAARRSGVLNSVYDWGVRTFGQRFWQIVGLVALLLFLGGCAVAMLLILGTSIGIQGFVVGICLAILPVPFLIAAFMWLDRYEPEPTRYLAFCLIWGGFVATLVALFVNDGMAALFKHVGLPQDLVAVLVAPVIEESMKALGPVLLLLYTIKKKRRTINGIVDSIVFFGISATGFAFSENILYLGGQGFDAGSNTGGTAGGLQAALGVFIVRIPLSGFAHPLFTSMTAVGVGVEVRATNKRVRILAPLAGWFGAMLLHGSWNLMSVLAADTKHLQILLYGYFSVFMPIFFAQVTFVMWLRSAEGRLTSTKLADYVRAGWISPPEVASLASIGRRRSARTWAKRIAGKPGDQGMRGFQLAATQLALLRDRMDRRTEAGSPVQARDQQEEQQLLALIGAYRSAYVGRDPSMPRALWDGARYHIAFPDGQVRLIDAPPVPVMPVPVVRAPMPAWPYGAYPPPGPYPPYMPR
ncbi:MAG TPA: PrsW family intramembrane metalloprotease [Micromonosporaceae bacterium]